MLNKLYKIHNTNNKVAYPPLLVNSHAICFTIFIQIFFQSTRAKCQKSLILTL